MLTIAFEILHVVAVAVAAGIGFSLGVMLFIKISDHLELW